MGKTTVPASPAKSRLPSIRLVEQTVRITLSMQSRIKTYQARHDGKQLADAWRDIINAGLETLNVPRGDTLARIGPAEAIRQAA